MSKGAVSVFFMATTFLLLSEGMSDCANLDTPVVRVPTVAAEIRRGDNDARDCGRDAIKSPGYGEFSICLMGKINLDTNNGEPTQYYRFGAFLAGLNECEIIGIFKNPNAKIDRDISNRAKCVADIREFLDPIQKKYQLSVSDYCEAMRVNNMTDCIAKMSVPFVH